MHITISIKYKIYSNACYNWQLNIKFTVMRSTISITY